VDDAQLSMSTVSASTRKEAINLANHRKHAALSILITTDSLAH